jgi:hypothetical protein
MPQLSSAPPTTLAPFRGPRTTIEEMRRAATGVRGERSVRVRSFTERIIRDLQPKDYLGEILALRYAEAEFCRYTNDPIATEWVKDPERIVEEIEATGKSLVDCDEKACFIATLCRQVGREAEFVTVGFGAAGHYSHVFTRVKEPKSGQWIICDSVAGTTERRMRDRVTTYQFWRID